MLWAKYTIRPETGRILSTTFPVIIVTVGLGWHTVSVEQGRWSVPRLHMSEHGEVSNDTDTGSRINGEKYVPLQLCTTNPSRIVLGANPGLRSERMETNRLSYGMAGLLSRYFSHILVDISRHPYLDATTPHVFVSYNTGLHVTTVKPCILIMWFAERCCQ
jgi:hypothetical protein